MIMYQDITLVKASRKSESNYLHVATGGGGGGGGGVCTLTTLLVVVAAMQCS